MLPSRKLTIEIYNIYFEIVYPYFGCQPTIFLSFHKYHLPLNLPIVLEYRNLHHLFP